MHTLDEYREMAVSMLGDDVDQEAMDRFANDLDMQKKYGDNYVAYLYTHEEIDGKSRVGREVVAIGKRIRDLSGKMEELQGKNWWDNLREIGNVQFFPPMPSKIDAES